MRKLEKLNSYDLISDFVWGLEPYNTNALEAEIERRGNENNESSQNT